MEEGVTRSQRITDRLASGWLYWPVCLTACGLIALGVLGPEAERLLSLQAQAAVQHSEQEGLRRLHEQQLATRDALLHDPHYVDHVVRRELGVIEPGEIRLPRPAPQARPTWTAPAPPPPPTWLRGLAVFAAPRVRVTALVTGGVLLAAGIVLSLPAPAAKEQPTAG